MKVYLAKKNTDYPVFGSVPDLTQCETFDADSFEISDEECDLLDQHFIDKTNELCGTALDIGDYQYYNTDQCKLLKTWIENELHHKTEPLLNYLYSRLKCYLDYAISNSTGIAIEL